MMNALPIRFEFAVLGRLLTALAVFAAVQLAVLQNAAAHAVPASVADLSEKLSPAVVNISTSQTVSQSIPVPELPDGSPLQEFFEDFFKRQQRDESQPQTRSSLGSGFVVDPSGIIVTNRHVIADADEIEVTFPDQTKLIAKVIGQDAKTDIAVLKVESDKPLPSLTFGSSKGLRVGDWVMAIGNPFGLGGTVTLGIVSARNREITEGHYVDYIQTDAAINRGNSGGPLFNMEGEVIGINTAIISPTGGSIGLGFAIPSDTAQSIVAQLQEFGETRRGWLGVRIQTITEELAETFGLESTKGALVADVMADGPAKAAGIEAGDVIVNFDGKAVLAMRHLPRIVGETPVGKEVEVVVIRGGEEKSFDVTLGRLEDAETEQTEVSSDGTKEEEESAEKVKTSLGLQLSLLTDDLREQYKINEKVSGVLITEVEADSTAAGKSVSAGDVIVEVGQKKVASPDEVLTRVEELKDKGHKSILLKLANKNNDLRFLALRVKPKPEPEPKAEPESEE
jgi:serine protease Do